MQLLQYWKVAVVVAILAFGAWYIRSAEGAKQALAETRARAALADTLARLREIESAAYTQQIDSLKVVAQDADSQYQALLKRPPRRVFIPVAPADSTQGEPSVDTTSVWEIPEVKEALELCEDRVENRDRIIEKQDKRHFVDSMLITELRALVPAPIEPPKPPSRLRRVVEGAAQGLVVGVVAQQATGQKGLVIGTSLGAIFGFFR